MGMDSKQRFSNRVENYVKFRPDYPREILAMLRERVGLTPEWKIADIGSGTGISARMFLENGNEVFAVEPNPAMRAAAESTLGSSPKFHSIDGSAEQTTLADRSVDFVVSAQAFHWFDPEKSKAEFTRITTRRGWCVLIWNERKTSGSQFLEEYEDLLKRYSADYMAVRHERIGLGELERFYGPNGYSFQSFANQQMLDLDGLIGRCLSSSYAPAAGDPKHGPMVEELRQTFDRNQTDGRVNFDYTTTVYFGKLSG
jgi:ubiquinone/menaquinone biosynthesis C-methylase UbiE